jgi:hypothetical protein
VSNSRAALSRETLRRVAGGGAFLGLGVADAAFSSLAGFAASFYAVRFLDTGALGIYSLFLSAALTAGLVPQHLYYLPAQVAALAWPRPARAALARRALGPGLGLSAVAAMAVTAAGLLVRDRAGGDVLPLSLTAAALVLLLPAQDHVRSCFHLARLHSQAALLALTQLAATIAAITALHLANAPPAWVPLGSLCAGALASMLAGAFAAGGGQPGLLPLRGLMRSGSSLLPAAALPEASILVSSALLAALTSVSVLGSAEAARIIARPVQVLALGLGRSLAPRLMEAGHSRAPGEAIRASVLYATCLSLAGAGYLLVAGWDHALNPLATLLPLAYASPGLAALSIAAALVGAVAQIPRALLLGARSNVTLLAVAAVGAAVRAGLVVGLARAIGVYSLPLSQVGSAAAAGALSLQAARRAFRRA